MSKPQDKREILEGLPRLVRALTIGEGFQFLLLACDTPRTCDLALAQLTGELGKRLEREVRLQRFAPDHLQLAQDPASTASTLTQWFSQLPAAGPNEWVLVVLDASRAARDEEPAWTEIFSRMNERRNELTRSLPGPLLLCVPTWLEGVFARAAPDFWSIRSLVVSVQGPRLAMERLFEIPANAVPESSQQAEVERSLRDEIEKVRAANAPAEVKDAQLAVLWYQLGEWFTARGNLSAALAPLEQAVELSRRSSQDGRRTAELEAYASALQLLGVTYLTVEDTRGARKHLEDALTTYRRLSEEKPSRQDLRVSTALVLLRLAALNFQEGQLDEAARKCRESLKALPKATGEPTVVDQRRAEAHEMLALIHARRGETVEAEQELKRGISILENLVKHHPRMPNFARALSHANESLANALLQSGKLDPAASALEEALKYRLIVLQQLPDSISDQSQRITIVRELATLHFIRGDLDRAETVLQQAMVAAQNLAMLAPDSIYVALQRATILTSLGDIHLERGATETGFKAYRAAAEHIRELRRLHPAPTLIGLLASITIKLGGVLQAQGKLAEAETAYVEAVQLAREGLNADPDNPDRLREAAIALHGLANVRLDQGDHATAREPLAEDEKISRQLLALEPDNPIRVHDLARTRMTQARLEEQAGDSDRAIGLLRNARASLHRIGADHPEFAEFQQQLRSCEEELARLEGQTPTDP